MLIAGCGSVHTPSARAPSARAPSARVGEHLSCQREVTEADVWPPARIRPHAGDLVIGPVSFPGGLRLAQMRPRQFLASGSLGAYKLPPVLAPGATVTISIAPAARGYVVMDIPEGPPGGVEAASYSGCRHAWGFFPQAFRFTNHRVSGCVPMEVTVQGERPRSTVLSLFAGHCQA